MLGLAIVMAVCDAGSGEAWNKHGSSSVNCLRLSRITIN